MKYILVTGGCGFIGSHCILEIIKDSAYEGYGIVALDNFSNSDISITHSILAENKKLGTKCKLFFHKIDIAKMDLLYALFGKYTFEYVIHFAAYKSVGESVSDPLKYYNNNITGLLNILNCMKEYKVKNIIFSSSATVYGNPEKLPISENTSINILNPYGRTKYFAEEILKDCSKAGNIKAIILRYFNPVGAYSKEFQENPVGKPNNLFPYIMNVLKGKEKELSVFGDDWNTPDGTPIRDYIHVVDLAKGHIAAMKYFNSALSKDYDIINLGTGRGYSVLEVVKTFERLSGKTINYKIVKRREGDAESVYADNKKAIINMGWFPTLNLEDMVKSCL